MVERSITGEDLIAELDRLAVGPGAYPTVLRCDNGPELACTAMADWAQVARHAAAAAITHPQLHLRAGDPNRAHQLSTDPFGPVLPLADTVLYLDRSPTPACVPIAGSPSS
jgi:hypothetical protein